MLLFSVKFFQYFPNGLRLRKGILALFLHSNMENTVIHMFFWCCLIPSLPFRPEWSPTIFKSPWKEFQGIVYYIRNNHSGRKEGKEGSDRRSLRFRKKRAKRQKGIAVMPTKRERRPRIKSVSENNHASRVVMDQLNKRIDQWVMEPLDLILEPLAKIPFIRIQSKGDRAIFYPRRRSRTDTRAEQATIFWRLKAGKAALTWADSYNCKGYR